MSETSETETGAVTGSKRVRESKRSSIPSAAVDAMIDGLPRHSKASFTIVGHRNGVRIALPRTNGVGRAFFYGDGDYSLVPRHPAIRVFSEQERREGRRGGIMAEVSFELGVEAAVEALQALVDAVRAAPPPPERGTRPPKEPKTPKGPKASKADTAPADPSDRLVQGCDDLTCSDGVDADAGETPSPSGD